MNGELAGRDVLLIAGMLNELFGEFGRFAISHHPASDIAAEHVEDHIQVVEAPLHRPA